MPRSYSTEPMHRRAAAALTVISRQATDTPKNRLMFAIFSQAVRDVVSTDPKASAESAALYLEGPMPHLEYCGIDTDWAREVLDVAGIRLGSYNAESSSPSPS